MIRPPTNKDFTEIASTTVDRTAWEQISIPRPLIMKPVAGAHLVKYTPGPPDALSITEGRHYTAFDGICYFLDPDIHDWYVNVPTEATPASVKFVLIDSLLAAIAPSIASGSSSPVSPTAIWTMAAPAANADVDQVSEVLIAASPTRKFLYLKNTSTGSQIISIAFGAAAVSLSGVTLNPGEWVADGLAGEACSSKATWGC